MKNKLNIVISVIVVIVLLVAILFFVSIEDKQTKYTEDEIKFKEEYESVNGLELTEDYILKTLDIKSDNNVEYIDDNEIVDLLKNGTNVIYLGWNECNWCRSVLPSLLEVVSKNNIEKLYYFNFKKLRTAYENNTDSKSVKIYEDIIEIIGEDITSVFNEESLRANEKKILAPTVIFIKDGKYVGLHAVSVPSQINATDELTKEQEKELMSIYQTHIDKLKSNVCIENEGC
ncbi:MAG: hypothetical protein IJD92_01660 [Bacilli bacterium]|nr:hypothetical protein [Bacilli bacterium]